MIIRHALRLRGPLCPDDETNVKAVLSVLLFSLVGFAQACADAEWPQFRGPDGQGHATSSDVPTEWSESKNIRWKSAIPGSGWSSPVIAKDQIWLTTSTDEGRSLRAICVSRATGQIQHNVEVFSRAEAEHVNSQNSHATPTAVIDGDHVFVHFGANGTAGLTRDGEVIWRNTQLKYLTPHGGGNSPIVHGDLLVVCCDGEDKQFVAALDKQTGDVVWRRERAHMEDAHRKSREEKNEGRKGLPFISFSTPLVVDVDGTALLVSTPADHVVANRVDTGEEVWWLPYNCFSLVARPVYGNGVVYAIGGLKDGHYALYAIPANARGRVTEADLAWMRQDTIPQCPSPVLVGHRLFFIKDSGIATCVDATSGDELWKKRIGGNYRSSPVAVGDRVYFCSQKGKTTVIQLADEFAELATNHLDGIFLASPAVAGRSLFLRSDSHLYRIEAQYE